MKKQLLFPLLGFFLPLCLNGQTPSAGPAPAPTPPAPPLLHRVPDMTEWGITYAMEAKGDASQTGEVEKIGKKKAAPVKARTVLKGKGMVLEVTSDGVGSSLQTWHLPGGITLNSTDGKKWSVGTGGHPGFDTADYATQDFAGLGWISANNFIGEKSFQGRKCFAFEDKVVTVEQQELETAKSDISRNFTWVKLDTKGNVLEKDDAKRMVFNIEDYKNPVVAYIDEETRLPVALIYKTPNGVMTRSYQFQKLSTLPAPPSEAHKALDSYKDREQRLSGAPAPI